MFGFYRFTRGTYEDCKIIEVTIGACKLEICEDRKVRSRELYLDAGSSKISRKSI